MTINQSNISNVEYENLLRYIKETNTNVVQAAIALSKHKTLFDKNKKEMKILLKKLVNMFKNEDDIVNMSIKLMKSLVLVSNINVSIIRSSEIIASLTIFIVDTVDTYLKTFPHGYDLGIQLADTWILVNKADKFTITELENAFKLDEEVWTNTYMRTPRYHIIKSLPQLRIISSYQPNFNWYRFEFIFCCFKTIEDVEFLIELANSILYTSCTLTKQNQMDISMNVIKHVLDFINFFNYEQTNTKRALNTLFESQYFNLNDSNPFRKSIISSICAHDITQKKIHLIHSILSYVSIYDLLTQDPLLRRSLSYTRCGISEQIKLLLTEFSLMHLCGMNIPKNLNKFLQLESIKLFVKQVSNDIDHTVSTMMQQSKYNVFEICLIISENFLIHYKDALVQKQFKQFIHNKVNGLANYL